ncbi:hypothetical protein LJK88_28270 [Paenibacillus sp. P26]|nr:hypothetical protein LJK88_28270 [Paenibacillus sp. P26]UUZ94773.1 hypothetical protein LJK87_09740 [Paenibacillus sp. P25]
MDSTVELLIDTGSPVINYFINYRLRRSGLASPLATLQISRNSNANMSGSTITEIPNLTWNDNISASVTYTVTIEVITATGISSITAQTRALNAIIF